MFLRDYISSLCVPDDWRKAENNVMLHRSENTYLSRMRAGSNRLLMFTVRIISLWKMVFILNKFEAPGGFLFWSKQAVICNLLTGFLTFLDLLLQFDCVWRFLLDVCSGLLIFWTTKNKPRVRKSLCLCRSVSVCVC